MNENDEPPETAEVIRARWSDCGCVQCRRVVALPDEALIWWATKIRGSSGRSADYALLERAERMGVAQ